MKNIIKIFGLLAGAVLLLASCKEDELLEYDKESNIYFPNQVYDYYDTRTALAWDDGNYYVAPAVAYAKANAAQDTLDYTIATGEVVVISVRLMGPLADHRREFACRAVSKTAAGVAKEGVNFEILDAFIPANSREGGILVRLNPEGMDDEDVLTIEFELLPNEHFQTNFVQSPRKSGSSDMVSTTKITLRYSNFLLPPSAWETDFKPALGPWSVKKINILATYFGFDTSSDFLYATPIPNINVLLSYGIALRQWLEDYEQEHGEVMREKNGDEMRVGQFVYDLY